MDWSTFPNILQGAALMIYALSSMGWSFDARRALLSYRSASS
jgi:hypothetical protein